MERREHADWVDRHRKKMSAASPLRRRRSALVEHPFGTIKRWAGIDHFLMRGLDKCRGEFSLMAPGYNFKRMVNELGVDAFREHGLAKAADRGDRCVILPGGPCFPVIKG